MHKDNIINIYFYPSNAAIADILLSDLNLD